MIVDLKNRYFGVYFTTLCFGFNNGDTIPYQTEIRKLHNRLVRRYYITTLPVKPPSSNSCSVQRIVYLLIRPGLLCTLRVLADLTGTMSRGRSFCRQLTNDEDTSEW